MSGRDVRLAPLPAARDRTAGKSSGRVDGVFLRGIGVADSGFNSRSGPVRFELKVGRIRQTIGKIHHEKKNASGKRIKFLLFVFF